MTKSVDMQSVLMAEQQILGYAHAAQGHSLTMLVESMGLSRDEWAAILSNDVVRIPKDVVDEIDAFFAS